MIEAQPVTTFAKKGLAIEVQNLDKVYREGIFFKKGIKAISDLSFNVNQGEIFGLLGPNGAGKTTFIKVLLGIIRKSGGWAKMLDHDAGSRAGRNLCGYLPEQLRVPKHLTGKTALEYYGNLSNVPTSVVKEKSDRLLEMVGLTARAGDRVSKYSKGMQQRLGLAQAMLHEPKLLILDEPTDGLDPRARAEVRSIIPALRDQGATILMNSHILQEVEMVCDHVAILDRGRLRYSGSVADIGAFVAEQQSQTPSTQLEVILDLLGEQEQISHLFQALPGSQFEVYGSDKIRVRTKLNDQDDVDRLVDTLRAAGVSIVNLSRKQITLEDAFLQIVESNQTG